jgi:FG-GAP-like repeat
MPWTRRNTAFCLILLALILTSNVVLAYYAKYAPIHSNFKHTPVDGTDLPPGLQLSGNRIIRGSPTIADIDGNSVNGKEIVVGGSDGMLYAYHQNGSLLWKYQVVSCDYPGYGYELITSAPSVGDLQGNGIKAVVVGYGSINKPSSCAGNDFGGALAINGTTGALIWRFKTPFDDMNGYILDATQSSPSLADVDGDGKLEIGFGSSNNNIYLLNASGQMLWKYRAYDSVWSSPAFADINGDGRKEMIIGTDFSPGNLTPQGSFSNAYGWVYAFDTAGGPNQNRQFGEGYIWAKQFDQSIYSSPAIADLDGDGTLEIVIGSSCYHPGAGKWVKVLNAATGNTERTLSTASCVVSSPALGDLNGDGKLDIVAGVSSLNQSDGKPHVEAWKTDGTVLWNVPVVSATGEYDNGVFFDHSNSPVIADLDGNGSLEVAVTVLNSVTILRGDNGQALTSVCGPSDSSPACQASRSLFMWYPNRSTPAISDLDNDGKLELVSGGSHTNNAFGGVDLKAGRGFLYAWRDFATFLGSPAGNQAPYSAPWPMFHGNPQHTGVYPQLVAPRSASGLILKGTSHTYPLSLARTDGAPFTWTIVESDPSGVITLNRTSGSASDTLDVTFNAPATAGVFNATLTVQSAGLSPVTIQLRFVSANQVFDAYMPIILR